MQNSMGGIGGGNDQTISMMNGIIIMCAWRNRSIKAILNGSITTLM